MKRAWDLTIHVEGTPAPQGSKTRTRYGFRESSKRVEPWRQAVTAAASRAGDDAALLGPIPEPYEIIIDFYIRKPRTTRHPSPTAPTVGDLDKLVRATNDALKKGGVILDDRYIIAATETKRWAGAHETPGAIIRIRGDHTLDNHGDD